MAEAEESGAAVAVEKPMGEGVSRRTFVKTAAVSAIALCGVGGVGLMGKDEPLLRPPGGQDERRLLAQCNRCERCVTVCHTRAIGTAALGDGLLQARTPVMRFNLGDCDFCGDCVKVCPTGALVPFDIPAAQSGDVAAARIGVAQLDPSICLSYISDSCNLCFTDCPYGAVELNANGNPVVVEEVCNGCGVCEHVCPVLSLRSYIGGSDRAITVVPVAGGERR